MGVSMKVCIKAGSILIFFTFLISSTLFCSSQDKTNKLNVTTFTAAERENLKIWHENQAPCPPNSLVGSPKPIKLPQFDAEFLARLKDTQQKPLRRRTRSLNDLPRQQIIASAMAAASQPNLPSRSNANMLIRNMPSPLALKRDTNDLKSQDLKKSV